MMASYVDRQLRAASARLESPEWKRAVEILEARKKELRALQSEPAKVGGFVGRWAGAQG
jgi:hypothetical protein